jgi:hypothetical protein
MEKTTMELGDWQDELMWAYPEITDEELTNSDHLWLEGWTVEEVAKMLARKS